MFKNIKSFYIIGIGGISLSALAVILQNQGYYVCGTDVCLSSITKALEERGIEIMQGSSSKFVERCDACVYTAAISCDNPDLLLAKKLGKKLLSRAELLGLISQEKKCISVAGTHGKTTTTGMLASVMLSAGLDPTIHIGGILNEINSNVHIGKGEYFVTEACEYKDSFLCLESFISVVLNVETDHMDYFKNMNNLNNSFKKFIKNTKKEGFCIVNSDIFSKFGSQGVKSFSFGVSSGAMLRAEEIDLWKPGRYCYNLYLFNEYICKIHLSAFGKHNVVNSLAVVWVCLLLNIDIKFIQAGLMNFKGVARRMESVCDDPFVIHDYAHHPTEIRSTLEVCKKIKEKVICIFQPHTFSRTRDLYEDFLTCFNQADEVWLLPIYPAREEPIEGITSLKLAKDLCSRNVDCKFFHTFNECKSQILNYKEDCLFAILGAGDIENLAKMIIKR